jgi:hypothetical protein
VAGIEAFHLGQDDAAQPGRQLVQAHQRRPTDGLGYVRINVHLSTFLWSLFKRLGFKQMLGFKPPPPSLFPRNRRSGDLAYGDRDASWTAFSSPAVPKA